MFNEIGSDFYLQEDQSQTEVHYFELKKSPEIVYLDSGRSAIELALNQFFDDSKTALLPAFTCDSVIHPFIKKGYKIIFYNVLHNLKLQKEYFIKLITDVKPSVILVHSYFGFDTLTNIRDFLRDLRGSGIHVIEDITQCLFTKRDFECAEYTIASFRKWCALPDGGFLASSMNPIIKNELIENSNYVSEQLKGFLLKGKYVRENHSELKQEYRFTFNKAKDLLENKDQIYAMSKYSQNLFTTYDIEVIARRRRSNYSALYNALKNISKIELPLPEVHQEVPLYFSMYVDFDRTDFQQYMAQHHIYLPVVWPLTPLCRECIDENTQYIYDHIISIPCDQRYECENMNRIVKHILTYIERNHENSYMNISS